MPTTLSDKTEKTLGELREKNQVLEDQLDLLCRRIWELEKKNRKLAEPVIMANKTDQLIYVSQIDCEYLAVSLTEIKAGAQKLVEIKGRRWEVS